jgi:hypothetical protein
VILDRAADRGESGADRGEVIGLALVEAGDLLAVRGELVERCGDRVAGHGQLQGNAVPGGNGSGGSSSSLTAGLGAAWAARAGVRAAVAWPRRRAFL